MLQQTQIATATPYYERFVSRFPTVAALARAPLDDVLAAWAGLGYYRRARSLHAAAGLVLREHAGVVPADQAAFAALPGVGRYTTGAVLSIAHGARLPVLDGNVGRVFARWSAAPLQLKRPADARVLWERADAWMPARAADAGDWNQALMELGATVCTPRIPKCDACPVATWCAAFAQGRPDAYPPAAARRETVRVKRAVAWIEHRGRVLVVRRSGELLDGLWEMPGADVARWSEAEAALGAALRELGVRATLHATKLRLKHAITHRAIEVRVWKGSTNTPAGATGRFVLPSRTKLALTSATRKLVAAAGERGQTISM
jgi:A/G-specific adenine glycosylase